MAIGLLESHWNFPHAPLLPLRSWPVRKLILFFGSAYVKHARDTKTDWYLLETALFLASVATEVCLDKLLKVRFWKPPYVQMYGSYSFKHHTLFNQPVLLLPEPYLHSCPCQGIRVGAAAEGGPHAWEVLAFSQRDERRHSR